MIWILLAMVGILALAVLIALYVAYPHRGEDVPNAPWVGQAMRRGVDRLPTLDSQTDEQKYDDPNRATPAPLSQPPDAPAWSARPAV